MDDARIDVPKDVMNRIGRGTLMKALGIEYIESLDGRLRATMPVDERTRQPQGLLHGGASVALAETLGSSASFMLIDQETQFCVGLEINANHLRAVREGRVTGIALPIHIGRSIHVWEIRITDEEERLVCISRLTVAVRDKR